MADAEDVRRLALTLPDVEEIDSDGFDFRVGGKGFVWSYPERRAGQPRRIRTDVAVLYVGDEAEKQALLLGEPGIFFTTPEYGSWPLVLVRLTEVDVERLTELVTDAWRMRAPELCRDQELRRRGTNAPAGCREAGRPGGREMAECDRDDKRHGSQRQRRGHVYRVTAAERRWFLPLVRCRRCR